MARYIGEYQGKLDGKGRVVIPSALKRQIAVEHWPSLIVNRGFDECLTVYTRQDWEAELDKLKGLSNFNRKDRLFMRLFSNGATEVSIDKASRILIPKKLQEYASMDSEVVFYAYDKKIEVWAKEKYEEMMDLDPNELADLAEDVMSKEGRDGND